MWTPEQLGKMGGRDPKWYAYPTALEGVTVRVEGEDPQEVCDVANRIESVLGAAASCQRMRK